jgi:hypothetical protein
VWISLPGALANVITPGREWTIEAGFSDASIENIAARNGHGRADDRHFDAYFRDNLFSN